MACTENSTREFSFLASTLVNNSYKTIKLSMPSNAEAKKASTFAKVGENGSLRFSLALSSKFTPYYINVTIDYTLSLIDIRSTHVINARSIMVMYNYNIKRIL